MHSTFRSLAALSAMSVLSVSILSACASTPDPAKVCTTEWISERAGKATGKIEKRANSSLKALRKTSNSFARGKSLNFLDKLALLNALNGMKKELTRGQGIKDLKTVAKTCNDPNIIKNAMTGLMKRQGISDSFITRVESHPIYQSVISSISEPTPVERPR